MTKPSIPKGTRDFSPSEMMRRDYIFDTIRKVFRMYGYQPIETPAMENLSTLLGKYGEEGDKLLFRILNSGDYLAGVPADELAVRDSARLSGRICEKGLRYDLTVPFARYIVQHQGEIAFPFKRYQIQPVWRADRPQKGRYREFFQCDVDVIGSDSLLNEYELIKIIDEVFSRLGIRITVKINNRKILTGIAEIAGASDKITEITVGIDKIEKIGLDEVIRELLGKGVSDEAIGKLKPLFDLKGGTPEKIAGLEVLLASSGTGMKGVEEIKTLFALLSQNPPSCVTDLDLTLARGLNYYTGAIIEVKSDEVNIGSICGGGRYDNLAGIFGLEGVSGVGVSFGADRIYDVMLNLELFDEGKSHPAKVLIANFSNEEAGFNLRLLEELHEGGISAFLYPDPSKLRKQMAFADSNRIPFVAMAGSDEIRNNEVSIRNMSTGDQVKIPVEEVAQYLQKQ